MFKIEDMYISLKNIRLINYKTVSNEYGYQSHYITITYTDNITIEKSISNYSQYVDLSTLIVKELGEDKDE